MSTYFAVYYVFSDRSAIAKREVQPYELIQPMNWKIENSGLSNIGSDETTYLCLNCRDYVYDNDKRNNGRLTQYLLSKPLIIWGCPKSRLHSIWFFCINVRAA